MLDEELRHGRKGEAEVVIGGADRARGAALGWLGRDATAARSSGHGRPSSDGELQIVRGFDLERDVISATTASTAARCFPFAVAMELMAETAAAAGPALELAGLRDIRLLQRRRPSTRPAHAVRVSAGPARPTATTFEITISAEDDRPHYRSMVGLRRPGGDAPRERPGRPSFPTASRPSR